jgi:uncharacterized protein YceK
MDSTPDTSLIARTLGQNWKTTIGGTLAAAGGVLATQTTGRWQLVGSIMLAVGLAWTGYNCRDKAVSSQQMDNAAPLPPPANPPPAPPAPGPLPRVADIRCQPPNLLLLGLCACLLSGCGTLCTRSTCGYNTFGSRPYEAVAQDVMVIGDTRADAIGVAVTAFCVVSVPVDAVVDTVALPIDAVAWMYGCQKQPAWHFTNQWH